MDLIYQLTESDKSMKHEEERELSTPASTPNPLSPIMPLGEATQWLREYFTREPAFTPGDDFGTCFSSYAAVMLSDGHRHRIARDSCWRNLLPRSLRRRCMQRHAPR